MNKIKNIRRIGPYESFCRGEEHTALASPRPENSAAAAPHTELIKNIEIIAAVCSAVAANH
jgi:hypothetical protein